MLEVKHPVRHNGKRYLPGDVIKNVTKEQANLLVVTGTCDWQRVQPAPSLSNPVVVRTEEAQDTIDWDELSKRYHVAFGNYEIPGVGRVKGKDAAVEALKRLQGQEGM